MKLEIGNWYKLIDHHCDYYFKYIGDDKQSYYARYEECIQVNEYKKHKSGFAYKHCSFKKVELSEISSFLPDNHPDKQLKSEDFIGKWVTCKSDYWEKGSYCLVESIGKSFSEFIIHYSKGFLKPLMDKDDEWTIIYLSDLQIVSEAEVAKKAIEYGHDLRKLGLHQFISVNKVTKEDLYNTKIWIGNNKSLSKKVQERLFELGFKYFDNGKTILDACAIFIYENCLKRTDDIKDEEYFNKHLNTEITLVDLGLEETVIDCNELIYNQPIEIIPVIKTTDINIPDIILTNNKLTI